MTRVGIDMDGTLINNDPTWAEYYNSYYEEHKHKELHGGTSPTWSYVSDLCPICFHEVVHNPDILSRASIMDGALEGIDKLSKVKGVDSLFLISHRPPELLEPATELIRKLGVFDYFINLEWSWEDKLTTCRRDGIGILVDDGPKNILSLRGTEVVGIIFDQIYNKNVPGIRACNWRDVPRLVSNIIQYKETR